MDVPSCVTHVLLNVIIKEIRFGLLSKDGKNKGRVPDEESLLHRSQETQQQIFFLDFTADFKHYSIF